MEIRLLSFLITNRCNAACDICCLQCSPENTEVMDISVIKRYLDEAKALGDVEEIGFSGGEPFLYPELLVEAARYTHDVCGLPVSVVTNGFWGANPEKGKKLIAELVQSGVRSVRISADRHHQEYVPAEAVKNAINIAFMAGVLKEITIMDTRDQRGLAETIEALRPEIYKSKIAYYPLVLTDRVRSNPAVKLTDENIFHQFPRDKCFCADMRGAQINSDGWIYACCSQFAFDIPRLRLGRVGEMTLAEAKKIINEDPFLDLIRRCGLGTLADMAEELGHPVKEKYALSCELCHDMLCKEELVRKLEPLVIKKVEEQRIAKLFGNL